MHGTPASPCAEGPSLGGAHNANAMSRVADAWGRELIDDESREQPGIGGVMAA